MKILLFSSRYAPHGNGGAERVTRTLAQGLRQAGVDVVVLTLAMGSDDPDRVVDDIRVRSIPLRNVYGLSDPIQPLKPLWHALDSLNPLMRSGIDRLIVEERPDLVNTHLLTGFSPVAWEVARARSIPVVHTLHDYYLLCARSTMAVDGVLCVRQHLDCALLSMPRIRSTRNVQAVVGVSPFVLQRHAAHGAFRNALSTVIPNPCHLVGTPPSAPTDTGVMRFGFMGRLEPAKGLHLLLDAAATLPRGGWSLSIAGAGSRPATPSAAHESVTFVGRVDPRVFLSSIDVLVVPSLVPETFGLSAAEALAMGVPVIASTRGALPDLIVPGRNGWLFDPDVGGSLAESMRQRLTHPPSAGMREFCRDSVAHLDPSRIVGLYRDLYESLLASAGKG